jgi:hypothetical protein
VFPRRGPEGLLFHCGLQVHPLNRVAAAAAALGRHLALCAHDPPAFGAAPYAANVQLEPQSGTFHLN